MASCFRRRALCGERCWRPRGLTSLSIEDPSREAVYSELERRAIELGVEPEKEEAPRASPAVTTTDALQLFLREAGKHPLLTSAQEVELAKRIERGDGMANERMIQSNLRLVVS